MIVSGFAVDGLLDGDSSADRVDRAGKHDHEAVAEVLDLTPAVVGDRFPQQADVVAPERFGGVVAQALEQLCGADHVGEEQRYGAL